MSVAAPRIPARYYARLGEALLRQGYDLGALLQAARLRPEQLARPEATLTLVQVERLVTETLRFTGRPDLAIDFGRALKLSSHSIVGYGILSSPDVDYALRLTARFFGLIMPSFRMRYRRDSTVAEILFQPALPMSAMCLQLHLEAIAVATHFELRELLQNDMPRYELDLSIAEPAHAARYAELVEARCRFGLEPGPGLRMRFPATMAARTLSLADPHSLKMAEARCQALVRNALAGGKVSDWVAMMLREASDGMPGIEQLAHTLHLSARTLDRYLKREGHGFRELLQQARQERACRLLGEARLSVTQIAHELGYTDAANFARAFRRRNALSPGDWRLREACRRRRGN